MKLDKDLKAPHFRAKDIYGRIIDLNDYTDKKVFIGFFRHAGCPFCNIRVHSLTKVSAELKQKGLEMIFFFESKEKVLLNSSFHNEVSPIPLISDPEKKHYEAYGLENSALKSTISHISTFVQTAFKARTLGVPMHLMADGESINTIPAEFLVDKGLFVKEVHYSESLTDRMSMDKIKAFADN
ncbi:redoxin domain-containing protein [Rhodocytophaga aerolata]|uniref:Redoxin domain-containing protein n=1 Tax=Rhodocytophaga aerolata TaxID=455078 RepID=A0ABT8R636_9BACT|nr:redoxin domain-containing protein [Rhodocytophaga aerolata]MDO1446829.1 redoxin domain-containing protein [Rhodocytophaga aerolata]